MIFLQNKYNMKVKFDYKWIIVSLCFLMVFVCLGFCSSNKSLYLSPITQALGIKRSAFSIGDSIRYITTAVVNMFFGLLVYKFGTKKLIGAGFICLILSCLFYSFSNVLAGFYIAGAFLGVGFSWTTTTMVGCVINKWCTNNKGTIMGAVLAANGVGAAFSAQLLSPIIYQEGNPFGYRNAYLLTSLILLIVGAVIMVFYKENPENTELIEKKDVKNEAQKPVKKGLSMSDAIRKPYFYCTTICIFLSGMMLQGISGIAAAHMTDVGLDTGYIATVLSIHSLALAMSKFIAGLMYDKLGMRVTVAACDIAAVFSMLTLAMLTNSPLGKILALAYGILSALALPLETIMLPIFANELFGVSAFDKMLGVFVSVNTAGYAVGVPLTNWAFDMYGSYRSILFVLCLIMVMVTIASQIVLTTAKK